MSDEQLGVDEFLAMLEIAESADDVDAVFVAASEMPAELKTKVIDAIEAKTVANFRETMPTGEELSELKVVLMQIDAAKGTPKGDLARAQMEATLGTAEALVSAQTFLNLSNAKGDKADPVVQAYAEAAGQMPDEEFSSAIGHLKLLVQVSEKVAPAAPKVVANPFRKPPAGPQP